MRHVATTRGGGWRAVLVASMLATPMLAFGQGRAGPSGPEATVLTVEHHTVTSVPMLHASQRLPHRPRRHLEEAFALAVHRVRTVPSCRALFDELDLDAHTALDFSIYYPARIDHEVSTCRRAVAFSYVGAGPTRLCRSFADLDLERAVEVVLHEALHRAGLKEHGAKPSGLLPSEIDALVHAACCQIDDPGGSPHDTTRVVELGRPRRGDPP